MQKLNIVILAAGFGQRMGALSGTPKALLSIWGKEVIYYFIDPISEVRPSVHLVTNGLFAYPLEIKL